MTGMRNIIGTYLGEGLIAVGVLHTASAVTEYRDQFAGIFNDGLWASVDVAGSGLRGEALWFTVSGTMLIVTGSLVRSYLRATGTLPKSFSVGLTMVGAAITVAMPDSGAWMALAVGVLAMIACSEERRTNHGERGLRTQSRAPVDLTV